MILQESDQENACQDQVGCLGGEETIKFVAILHRVDSHTLGENREGIEGQSRKGRIACQYPVKPMRFAPVSDGLFTPLRPAFDGDRIRMKNVTMELCRKGVYVVGEPLAFGLDCFERGNRCQLQPLCSLFQTVEEDIASNSLGQGIGLADR